MLEGKGEAGTGTSAPSAADASHADRGGFMMKALLGSMLAGAGCVLPLLAAAKPKKVTVPVTLDHNRMLVEAELEAKDGTWRKARLWVDTGNPDFFMSEALARALGVDLSEAKESDRELAVPAPAGIRIGGMPLRFDGVKSKVLLEPKWVFRTMHNDANLPSTVLKWYQVVFDYPKLRLTIADPGAMKPRGLRAAASVHGKTGIVQIDGVVDGETHSFALDNGASYSFVSEELLERLAARHPGWPRHSGALGCANIWGWWPQESVWPVMRLPELQWGPARLADVGMVGLPQASGFAAWYSQKTARPVSGILGPNAFKAFRIEIDFAASAVYFEKGAEFDSHDMDLVGLTLRPEADGTYQVIGVAKKDGKPAVEGAEPGDQLLQVNGLKTTGMTMGAVVDALRGKPGDRRTLVLERKTKTPPPEPSGKQFKIDAKVERFL
jgi:hypothetical protein